MKDNKKIFVLCSSTNIDSISSFYEAAIDNNRLIYADRYQLSNLDIVTNSIKEHPETNKRYDFNKQQIFPYKDTNPDLHKFMNDKGFCMFIRATKHSAPYFEKALKRFSDNIIIYSLWGGYRERGKPYADSEIIDFLDRAEKDYGSKIIEKHTSGHAYEDAIIEVCNTIKPEIIIPIHSEDTGRLEVLRAEGNVTQGEVKRFTGDIGEIEI
jgi:ribonuclease J